MESSSKTQAEEGLAEAQQESEAEQGITKGSRERGSNVLSGDRTPITKIGEEELQEAIRKGGEMNVSKEELKALLKKIGIAESSNALSEGKIPIKEIGEEELQKALREGGEMNVSEADLMNLLSKIVGGE